MKILVTGGSGFLGARLIPQLIRQGHEVFALSRSARADEKVNALGARPVRGDLEGTTPLVLPPVDAVVHAAAHFRFAGPRRPYFRTNVEGTARLLKAAEASGARTFVSVSAAAVVMDNRGSAVDRVNESAPVYPQSASAYIASKARAEAVVLGANRPGFRTIALRPPMIWGPGDRLSSHLPGAVRQGQFAWIDGGNSPYVTCHVDNLIEAIGLALDRGQGGRPYFINDPQSTTFRQFVEGVARTQGIPMDGVRSIPFGLGSFLASILEFGAWLTFSKDDPPLNRTMLRMIGREFTTSDADARRDLGYLGHVDFAEGFLRYRSAAPER